MRALIAAAVLMAVSVPAAAEVTKSTDTGFVVRQTATVPVPPMEAWTTLIAPAKWWNPAHTWSGKAENLYLDGQATGCFCEQLPLPDGAPAGMRKGSAEHMHLVQVNPGKVLRMSGALGPLQSEAVHGVLTITLRPEGEGTAILWEYVVGGFMRYKVEEIAPAVDGVLGEQLGRLAAALGGTGTAEAPPKAPAKAAPKAKPGTKSDKP